MKQVRIALKVPPEWIPKLAELGSNQSKVVKEIIADRLGVEMPVHGNRKRL